MKKREREGKKKLSNKGKKEELKNKKLRKNKERKN